MMEAVDSAQRTDGMRPMSDLVAQRGEVLFDG